MKHGKNISKQVFRLKSKMKAIGEHGMTIVELKRMIEILQGNDLMLHSEVT